MNTDNMFIEFLVCFLVVVPIVISAIRTCLLVSKLDNILQIQREDGLRTWTRISEGLNQLWHQSPIFKSDLAT